MRLKLVKVGAKWCPPCRAADRSGVLEKFAAKHPDVKLEQHDDPSEDGAPTAGTKRWSNFADSLGVKNLPSVIWFHAGEELFRTSDLSVRGLEQQYEKALRKAGLE